MAFPKGFFWGASTSSAQVEGGYDCGGKGLTNWDVRAIKHGNCSFKYASDFYHHYKEDIALMAEAGFKMFRLSISWARILPSGEGEVNQEGVDFYKSVFAECHKHGIEPLVTIFHFDLPQALVEKYGSWNNPAFADAYVNYCRVLFEQFKDDVNYWLTYNEQNMLIYFGAVDMVGGTMKIQDQNDLYNQAHKQLVAQARAIHLCHELCPGAKIGPAPNITTAYPADCDPVNYLAAMNNDDLRNHFYLDPLVFGAYPRSLDRYFALNGIKIETTPEEMELLRTCHPDFIGFNCYGNDTMEFCEYYKIDMEQLTHGDNRDMSYLQKLMEKPGIARAVGNPKFSAGEDGHRYDPYCIRVTARRLTDRYHLPLLVTENGYGRPDTLEPDGSVHDSYRIEHLRETIRQMSLGIEEGADLIGYCPWSALDLVSSREGITKRYGLIYVDRDEDDAKAATAEMKRYPKDSFYWYKKVIASNGEELD